MEIFSQEARDAPADEKASTVKARFAAVLS